MFGCDWMENGQYFTYNPHCTHLEEVVRVQLDAVLEPGNLGPGVAFCHTYEDDLSAERVLQLVVGRLSYSHLPETRPEQIHSD